MSINRWVDKEDVAHIYNGILMLLLLLLSHFSRVWLCATPSLGISRQEDWSGLPFPSPMHKSEKWKWSRSVVSDSSQPHGLQPTRLLHPWDFPARAPEWSAIAFSDNGILPSHETEWNNAVCSNRDATGDYPTKWSKSKRDKHHMISFICGIYNITQRNLYMKQKHNRGHREETGDRQGRVG